MDENANMRRYAGWRQDNLGLRAALSLAQHDPHAALGYFNAALDAQPTITAALAQAAQLGSDGFPREGLAHLDYFQSLPEPKTHSTWSMPSLHAWLLKRQGFMQDELVHLRGVLEDDVRARDEQVEPGKADGNSADTHGNR
jgi:hypothetical protein